MRAMLGCFCILVLAGCSSATGSRDDDGGAGNGSTSGGKGNGGSSGSGGSTATAGSASGGANASGGSGGTSSTAGAGGTNVAGGSGGSAASGGPNNGGDVTAQCSDPVGPGLPEDAPELVVGTWVDISPSYLDWGNGPFTQGMAVDPCNPAVLYLTSDAFDISFGGLHKSINGGASWTKIGLVSGETDKYIDEPIRVRIDPNDTQHLYLVDGVRGDTEGFWISTDGGATFSMPQSFKDIGTQEALFQYDVYDLAVDPTDFDHLLMSFHSAWGWEGKWNMSAGVLESTDGGESFIVHPPDGWGGYGHSINFLYNPELGLGDSGTWLLGTQGGSMMRTTDAGVTWTQVTTKGIQHGGGTVRYAQNGDLYATTGDTLIKSTDNGATWTGVGPGGGYNGIGGDGTNLYTAKCFGPTHMITATEANGATWTDFNSQNFDSGSFEMAFDATNKILYTASWGSGMWALKTE
ncbi:MAG TPA: hypothetical protein VGP93_07020 [Polyangiaceae bacterium]|jgi:hypothetical protein|nr:hypothetical protein [Polyangiaceae bacterium]